MAKLSRTSGLLLVAVLTSMILVSCGEDSTTEPPTSDMAIVTTGPVALITATTAEGAGEVTESGKDDVTDRGFCWSTESRPTISDSRVSAGEGLGIFTVPLADLTPETTYFVRAYALSSYGTAYGDEVSFTTRAN